MTQEIVPATTIETGPTEAKEPLPFPFQQHTFCRYETVEKRIEKGRILVVDSLLRDEDDLSDVARSEWASSASAHLKRERQIASMAVENILNNIERLVREPASQVIHVSELEQAEDEFNPDAIVLSGTLRDFDYYRPEILQGFGGFIRKTQTPVLAICGGHQLVGLSFGARVVTLDNLEQHEQRHDRPQEYQYRFIRITDTTDPILGGFSLLATSYLCRNQMMVKRQDNQLIYTVQFHLEKSFEDWNKSRTRWEHPNESRDGRILFQNFLSLALAHRDNLK